MEIHSNKAIGEAFEIIKFLIQAGHYSKQVNDDVVEQIVKDVDTLAVAFKGKVSTKD